jgi:Transposase DDE domain group 1
MRRKIVLNRPGIRGMSVYNERGTAEQWIKEGRSAIKWTRLSCRTFAANAVRLQLHVLVYNLGNFISYARCATQGSGAVVADYFA